ncbi:MAG: cytidylate kinase family protein [Candidatus Micrarchaeaceae archaeon]|jgi:cytidylate kinase
MLRICIGGLSCSGKTTLGEFLAKELNITHVTKRTLDTYKKLEDDFKASGDSQLKMLQAADKRYADAFDKEVVEIANSTDCVVTTWLGAWMIKDPAIRVWLSAGFDERARRYANNHDMKIDDAKDYVKKKDELTTSSFMDLYKIDIKNHSFFDMMINTERSSLEEAAALISLLAMNKDKTRFR